MKTQTFGTEIEMTGITRERAAQVIAEYFGTTSRYEGGGYKTYTAEDNKSRKWKVMYDSSIVAYKKVNGRRVSAGDDYRTEMVTPILTYDDMEDLQEIIRHLRKVGAMVNTSCGMHVHIGAERFTPQTLRNIVNIIASKEDILYKALQIDPNRLRYCKNIKCQAFMYKKSYIKMYNYSCLT